MPLVMVQASNLNTQQKRTLGDRIMEAFHAEGIPAASVVVLFQPDQSDIYLDGGLLHEAQCQQPLIARPESRSGAFEAPRAPFVPAYPQPQRMDEDFKTRARRKKSELDDLKHQLVVLLQTQGSLSSFSAQEQLGLKDCDWAPATLRRFFTELDEEGLIVKHGQKRGTRYVWQGQVSHSSSTMPKLVKASDTQNLDEHIEGESADQGNEDREGEF